MNAAATQAAEVQLRPEIHTQKNMLLLSDVAEIFTGSSQEAAMLSAVELMPAADARHADQHSDARNSRLLSMRGVNLANVQFTGAAQVVVIGGTIRRRNSICGGRRKCWCNKPSESPSKRSFII